MCHSEWLNGNNYMFGVQVEMLACIPFNSCMPTIA